MAQRTRRFGSFEVFSPWLTPQPAHSPSIDAAAAAFAEAGISPADVQVAQLQDTDSGAEIIHLAETGLVRARRAGKAAGHGATDVDGACRSTPTAAAWPTASRSARPDCGRCTRSSGSCRAARPAPGAGRPPVGFTHVYGAPGISACTVLTVDEGRRHEPCRT